MPCESPDDAERRRLARRAVRARKRQMLDTYKASLGCDDCKINEPGMTLTFDHVPERGPKLFSVSGSTNRSWKQILEELRKCDVVCWPCHQNREAKRGR
jgi:hypothetical protein